VEHVEDCQRLGLEVLPPDVNRSGVEFTVADGKICYALSAIKGCGTGAAAAVVKARESGGPYRSLFDFCRRLDPGTVNRAAIESLVKAGAFDALGGRRSQWFSVIDRAMQAGASAAADRRSGQKGLFAADDEEPAETTGTNLRSVPDLPEVPEWDPRDRLAKEKEVLGFYMSSHPLAEHEATLRAYCSHTTVEAAALKARTEVMLGGMLSAIKLAHTKNPKPGAPSRYAMFDLEDTAGTLRCILWPEQFVQYGELIQPDVVRIVRGAVDKRPGSEEANLIVNEILALDDLQARYTRGIIVRVHEEADGLAKLDLLHEILRGYPGECQLQLLVCLSGGSRVMCNCDAMKVAPNVQMRSRIEDLLGPGHVRLVTAAGRAR
jgi:DNA polymerase-3 subunit alpha